MAYEKQTWTNDASAVLDTRMNHIEQGIYDNSLATDKINPSGTATTTAEIEEGQINDVIGFKSLKLKGQTSQYTTTGKNKFNVNGTITNRNNATAVITNDVLKQTNTGTYSRTEWEITGLTANTSYTLKCKYSNPNGASIQLRLLESDNSTAIAQTSVSTSTSGTLEVTGTIPETSCYIRIYSNTLNETNNKVVEFSEIQLEAGSTATTYEKYTGGKASPNPDYPQDVNNVSGDNVITIGNVNLSEKWETGDINAYTGIESANTSVLRNTNYIHYDTSLTYRLSVNGAKPNNSVSLRFYNKNKEYIGYAQLIINGGSNFSITVSTSVSDTTPKYFRIRMATTVATLSDNIMVTTKSDLSYTEHQGNDFEINLGDIEICKIGTYQDYIFKKDGKWYKYGIITKKKVNGDDITITQSHSGDIYQYRASIGYLADIIQEPNPWGANVALCNFFEKYDVNELTKVGFTVGKNGQALFDSTETTLANFKAWVDSVNLLLYYVKATPVIEEITYTPLIRQLDELYNSGLYDVTNISQDNSGEAFILDIEACKNNINGIVEYIRR